MNRYSIALSALLSSSTIAVVSAESPWSYLSIGIPIALSDMAVSVVTVGDDNTSGNAAADDTAGVNSTAAVVNGDGGTKKKIVLTGGCVSDKGNEWLEGDDGYGFYACLELTNKAYSFEPIAPKTQFQAWTGKFESLSDMPRIRARHASVTLQNGKMLCVLGGRDTADQLITAIDCYDPATDTWMAEVMNIPGDYLSSDFAVHTTKDDVVYMIGGYNQNYEALSQVTLIDMSDLSNIKFTKGVPIDTPRGDITSAPMTDDGSTIMISGGFTHLNDFATPLNSVEQYDIGAQSWGDVDALNEERGDKQLINLNGKVYAIGGEGRVDASGLVSDEVFFIAAGQGSIVLDTVEVLDLTSANDAVNDEEEDEEVAAAEWKTHGDMPSSLFRFGASGWEEGGGSSSTSTDGSGGDGVIFVFGGQVGFEAECECFRTTEKVLVFDPSKQEAQSMTDGVGKGSAAGGNNAGVVIGGNVIVVGYVVAAMVTVLFV